MAKKPRKKPSQTPPRNRKSPDSQRFRDRITELTRVKAGELLTNPKNWRTHPDNQVAAVTGVLAEVGFASPLIARRLPSGELMLIDGHLRAGIDPDQEVPVVVLDVSEAEADKLLATLDPLAELATVDAAKLDELLRSEGVQTGDQALAALITDLAQQNDIILSDSELLDSGDATEAAPDQPVEEKYQLIVTLHTEADQRQLYEALDKEGHDVRVVTI